MRMLTEQIGYCLKAILHMCAVVRLDEKSYWIMQSRDLPDPLRNDINLWRFVESIESRSCWASVSPHVSEIQPFSDINLTTKCNDRYVIRVTKKKSCLLQCLGQPTTWKVLECVTSGALTILTSKPWNSSWEMKWYIGKIFRKYSQPACWTF